MIFIKKYYWIQVLENCNVGLAQQHLDIRFYVPDGLTKERLDELSLEISNAISEYGEENDDDYEKLNYHSVIEKAAERLNIKLEYPKVDHTIYV